MSAPRSARIQDHFATLTDPRRRKVVYPLINVVTIAICAVVAGGPGAGRVGVVQRDEARDRASPQRECAGPVDAS